MEIKTINGHTRVLNAPENWDQNEGECVGLPVMDQVTENGPVMVSEWQPTQEELNLLKIGMPIHLWIYGETHPVVCITAGHPTEDVLSTDNDDFIDRMYKEAKDGLPPNPKQAIYIIERIRHAQAEVHAQRRILETLNARFSANLTELEQLRSASSQNKSIGKLTYTVHTNTATLQRTINDLLASDELAKSSQTVDEYRDALASAIENKFAETIQISEEIALMPRTLTAENGAKSAMIGEFHEVIELTCRECDEDDEECEFCNRTGQLLQKVSVDWTTIKAIYAKAVQVCEVKSIS